MLQLPYDGTLCNPNGDVSYRTIAYAEVFVRTMLQLPYPNQTGTLCNPNGDALYRTIDYAECLRTYDAITAVGWYIV